MNKFKIYIFLFIILTGFSTGIFILYTYAEKTVFTIDTEASCVAASCHDNMGKKKYVHGVGVNGKHCTKCHAVINKGEHTFSLPERAVELCSQCHSGQYIAPSDVEGSPPVIITGADVFEEGQETSLHKPFAEGKCTECHDAHESDYYLHLRGSYPEGFYEIFQADAYGLCIKCHKDFGAVLTEPRTLTATQFRNGNLNLHYRHVNKTKGRTCKACHHPHGTENPKLIKTDFVFGLRNLSINFEKTETGGGCGPSCHAAVKYDRYSPVDIIMYTTPRPGRDATQAELRASRERYLNESAEKEEEDETGAAEEAEDAPQMKEEDKPDGRDNDDNP